ncbi:Myosin-IIIa [Geodia barretti]|uniref:non-specific serine/threonine protein kinase n=1 Tax=Geodia barretti TaxID=519541 RepID=A0AA35WD54_GEOBA|nr:Myosin-IIIa [Geodia barretti]
MMEDWKIFTVGIHILIMYVCYRYTGMLEAVRVRREGYSYRPFFSDFVSSYRSVAYCFTDEDVKLTEGACQVILDKAGLTGWRLARSRVFLRYYHEQRLQLLLKAMEDSATLVQKIYRGYRARKMFKPLKEKGRLQTTQVASLLSQIASHGQIHQPLLKALDRTDILEAPNRFKNRQKETAPPRTEVGPSSTDYDGLSTMQRKAKKAQKFGVKVGAVLGGADALQLALKRQNSPGNNRSRPPSAIENSSRPPSEILVPSRPPSEIEGSRPPSVFEPTLENDISRPPPPKYPPPRSKKAPPQPPGSSEDESRRSGSGSLTDGSPSSSPAHVSSATGSREGSPAEITNRVSHKKRPPPRTAAKPTSPRRNRRVLDPSSSSSSRPINISVIPNHTTSPSVPSSPVTSSSVRSLSVTSSSATSSSVMAANDGRSPGAANSSDVEPRRLSESILLSSSEMKMDTPLPRGKRPIGGVKSLPTDKDSSNKREAALQLISSNLESLPNGRTPHLKNGTQSSHTPHSSTRGQENTRGNTSTPASSGTDTSLRRRLLVTNSEGESTLDFAHVGGSSSGRGEAHIRYISSSVPDLLEDPPTLTGPSALLLGAPPIGIEAGRARGLASSSNVLYDSVTTMDHCGGVGVMGEGGSGFTSRSTSQYSDMSAVSGGSAVDTPPPQADKRKHKPWFGFKRSSRKKSSSSNESDMPLSPGGGRRESDTSVLGFYPGLSYNSAVEMVSGQPRGTYVLFKEELQEYSGVSSVYKLGVSSGREVKMFPILCTCGQYQLVNGAPQIHPPHTSLKSLVNHYKVSELDDSITLTQPRLVAGITVSLAPSRQPQMAKKRGRKKN